ncbi:MAG TPA: hypothetical protein VIE37_16170 [Methylomirabilota bacterium]
MLLNKREVNMLRAIRFAKGLGVVSVMAAILGLSTDSVSGYVFPVVGSTGGVKVITKSGKGNTTNSTSISSNGSTGDCTRARAIVVAASIAAPTTDSITATARCGDAIVVATAPDGLDTFTVVAQEVAPTLTTPLACTPTYAGTLNLSWTVTCVFLFQ